VTNRVPKDKIRSVIAVGDKRCSSKRGAGGRLIGGGLRRGRERARELSCSGRGGSDYLKGSGIFSDSESHLESSG